MTSSFGHPPPCYPNVIFGHPRHWFFMCHILKFKFDNFFKIIVISQIVIFTYFQNNFHSIYCHISKIRKKYYTDDITLIPPHPFILALGQTSVYVENSLKTRYHTNSPPPYLGDPEGPRGGGGVKGISSVLRLSYFKYDNFK